MALRYSIPPRATDPPRLWLPCAIASQLGVTDKIFWATKTEALYGGENAASGDAQVRGIHVQIRG